MNKNILLYRKQIQSYFSIENVFNTLLPYLSANKVELPSESSGFFKRLNNGFFVLRIKGKIFHITGNDHYIVFFLPRRRTILTIHDIEVIKRNKGIKRYLLKKLLFDWPIRFVGTVTTISNFSRNEIKDLVKTNKPIHVINNPVKEGLEFSIYSFNEKCPRILHIGTKKNKNLLRLIEALNGVNCQLHIVGRIDHLTQQKLEECNLTYINDYNLSQEEINKAYTDCDFLSFVSTYEGFGLPIIEAQSIGRPVLSSNIEPMLSVAGHAAVFVNPISVESIREGIETMINNHKLRDGLIIKGKENIKRFSSKSIAGKYNNLYSAVLDAK